VKIAMMRRKTSFEEGGGLNKAEERAKNNLLKAIDELISPSEEGGAKISPGSILSLILAIKQFSDDISYARSNGDALLSPNGMDHIFESLNDSFQSVTLEIFRELICQPKKRPKTENKSKDLQDIVRLRRGY
jgi:hypothetical protein